MGTFGCTDKLQDLAFYIMEQTNFVLLTLLNKAIDESSQIDPSDFDGVDWECVKNLSIAYGVHAIAFDAIGKLPPACRPERRVLIEWYGQIRFLEAEYEKKWKVACRLGALLDKANISAMVLKGRSLAQFYPIPSHRYSCDLDLFIADGWERACDVLANEGVKLVYEVYKEVEFRYCGVYVECHRYITPLRGNPNLQKFEAYLRSLLNSEPDTRFDNSALVNPPIMFVAMLFIEHALGDLLHGTFSLKHLVDWMVLKRLNIDWDEFQVRCKEFKFERFLDLINAMADVAEDSKKYDSLPVHYREVFDELFLMKEKEKGGQSWFKRRVALFFEIINNGKKYDRFGYCSMWSFLANSVWTHFFNKSVQIEGVG